MGNTAYEKFSDQIPLTREVRLPMVANSTAETAVEIDTDIPQGSKVGWIIYGMRYQFRVIASPHLPLSVGNVNGLALVQLCRGDVPDTPVFLDPGDADLILEEVIDVIQSTAVGFDYYAWPRTIRRSAVTQLPKLYLMFGSTADFTTLSDPLNELYAEILYHLVGAPEAPRERL